MPRHPRLFIRGATYHVYCRVARGEYVFDDDLEAAEFIKTLREVRDLDGLVVLAWCLMANHYHLVVRTETIDLWRSMARLQGRVSRSHNRRHRFLGRLWQSRYRARVVDTNEYFRQVVAYVHLNPVAAGIVDDPGEYANSGHREIIGGSEPHIIDLHSVLSGFSGEVSLQAAQHYRRWVRTAAEARWASAGVSELPWWAPASHVDEIASVEEHPQAETFDRHRIAQERAQLGLREFIDRYESISGLTMDELASRRRSMRHISGRSEFCVLAIARYRLRACDVASLLCKGRNSVTRWLNQGLSREKDDPEFAARLNSLDLAISRR